QACPGRSAQRGGTVRAVEPHSLGGQPVQVRGVHPRVADRRHRGGGLLVGGDHHHVGHSSVPWVMVSSEPVQLNDNGRSSVASRTKLSSGKCWWRISPYP